MATIFEYLSWRGDLSVTQAPLNPVDALILSRVSFLPFEGVVSPSPLHIIPLGVAAERLLALDDLAERVHMQADIQFLRALAKSARFAAVRLCAYVNEVDIETQKQFAAVVIGLPDGCHFISYRGTDNTLVGWKEDFNMTFMTPVPSQLEAVLYLERVAAAIDGPLYLGGHSKGGNLAVYAAAFCGDAVRQRIQQVYNNDGPGFDAAVITQPGYAAVRRRVSTFVPQSSIVGMLLTHEEEYTIVRSSQSGLMQHDLFSWEVQRDNFICLDTVTNSSRFIDKTIKDWMQAIEPQQREQWIDAIYSIFTETDVKTVKGLTAHWYKNAGLALKSLKGMDDSFKHITSQILLLLIKAAKQNVQMLKPKEVKLPLKRIHHAKPGQE